MTSISTNRIVSRVEEVSFLQQTMSSRSSMELEPAAAYAPGAVVEVEGPPKRPTQTERVLRSLCAWGDLSPLLFVGASDGTLRSYVADGRAGSLRWQADYKRLSHACCVFLDQWGVFATLGDSRLKLLDLPLQSNPQLDGARGLVARDDTKGAALFAAHEEAKTLCVLLKTNTLKVFDWTVNRILEPRAQHELQTLLPSSLPVQQLVLLGESHAFIQGKKDWVVLNLDSGRPLSVADDVVRQVQDALEGTVAVCPAVALPSRSLARRRQHVMDVLLCGKHHGVILTIDGEAKTVNPADAEEKDGFGAFDEDVSRFDEESAGKALDVSTSQLCMKVERVVAYNKAPRGVYYHHPFLLLDQAEQIAVYNFGSLQLVQTLPVKMPYGICAAVNVPSATVEDPYSNVPQFRDDRPATFYTVSPPFDVQAHQMLSIAQQVAASMGNRRLEDAVAFCRLCPDESPLSDADQRKLYADYGFELFRSARRQEAMNFFFESEIDVMEVLLLFPRNLIPRKASALLKDNRNNKKDHALEGDDLVESLLILIGFMRRKRNAYLRHEDLPSAMGIRVRHSIGPSEESALELIDTMLVKCLVVVAEKAEYEERARRALLEVVTGQNWCEIGEAEIFLRAHRRFKALLAFYSARKLHRKALELLEDLERSAASAAALSERSEAGRNEDQPQDTGDLQSSHDYMVLIAQYLRVLGKKHTELVFEFSRRVLSVNPALGLSIFTQREVPSSKKDIDPAAVLQHLKSCSIAASSSDVTLSDTERSAEDTSQPTLPLDSSQMLAIEYLTQVIYEGTCQLTPRLHDEVVYLLLDSIRAKTPQNQSLTSRVVSQRGTTGLLRRKLLQFLEFPGAVYHPERMLSRTPIEMVDEHAALLSKLGRHFEVLQLYALELKDAALAEAYCNRCYESKTADSSIYSTLLKIYLRPQYHAGGSASGAASPVIGSPPKPVWNRSTSSGLQSEAVNAAINLLNKYAERIDVSTALELLPADVPVAPLAGFFRRVLERQVQRFRNGQVKKQLSKMENFKVREQLSSKRKGSVTVWSSQSCQSCGKKLGVGTFVRLPSGTLLHYSCQPVP
ncbi:Vam6/Vps39-like protein [Phytophthora pseudosyringae]|uniref:Vam6/Vps39-like protein n=1 Tax=Phytophthora pseudosyringae TaxID=221518 RepID=A0A8T1VZ54_9STRA|nr:Vam6/Vps39-like protein [Phytophthora pseudosyringae]